MKQLLISACLAIYGLGSAQASATYYNGATNLTGYALKTKLSEIITNGHKDMGYDGLYDIYPTSDTDNYYEKDGTVLDMYSENPAGKDPYNFSHGQKKCGQYKVEGDCYNREHSIPQSIFNSARPMVSDAHQVLPTDGKVNGMRSNFPHGEVKTVKSTSLNGSKLGTSNVPGFSGTVFEPIDEFKGDFARIYFYFATRYEDKIASYSYGMFNNTKNQAFTSGFLAMLQKWHAQDPVSQKEIDRNNAVFAIQKNRNPYIDHPEWVTAIWGNKLATEDLAFSKNYKIYPNPAKSGGTITVQGDDLKKFDKAWIYNLVGQKVQEINQPFKNGNSIQINNLPKGIYILKTGELNTKFIVD